MKASFGFLPPLEPSLSALSDGWRQIPIPKPRQGPFPDDFAMELEFALGSLDFYIDVLFRFGPTPDVITVFHVAWEYV